MEKESRTNCIRRCRAEGDRHRVGKATRGRGRVKKKKGLRKWQAGNDT